MVTIVCPYCFSDFEPADMWFRCLEHEPALEFRWWEGRLRKPPKYAACTKGEHLCGIRLCPKCRRTLPYHIGRSEQLTIAVTGPRAAGKTLYLWSLLHELRGRLATEPEPFAAAMFEDDQSFEMYAALARSIFKDKELPSATQAKQQEKGNLPPTTVRLWCGRRLITLSLYDPAGELVENLQKIEFLSYLRHSAAIVYLVPPPDEVDKEGSLNTGADGLGNIVSHLRRSMAIPKSVLPKTLAVVMTQCDREVFKKHAPEEINPGYRWSQDEWRRYGGRERKEVAAVSEVCSDVLREYEYNSLVNTARDNFRACRFFAVSSLGSKPFTDDGDLNTNNLAPVGVECPLFWCLNEA